MIMKRASSSFSVEPQQTLNPNPNPKLDDDFYEIETIRRKRLRKGQLQYLIKWRGWPETANTWEPLENLQSVPDLIDGFEDSLKWGKLRKRKRKHAVHHTSPPKRRLERSPTSYSLRHFPTPQTPLISANSIAIANQNDYDPKPSELKATTNNADKLAIHILQPNPSTPNAVDCVDVEPLPTGCCKGAKRRKSGSVKRFNKHTFACDPAKPAFLGNNTRIKKIGDAKTVTNIVKILKPIGYSASLSDNTQDALVTFMAMRSDGTEVMVDNKYLKLYYPLLLINFYELHLRYNPTA